jgi:putative serine protease PepD
LFWTALAAAGAGAVATLAILAAFGLFSDEVVDPPTRRAERAADNAAAVARLASDIAPSIVTVSVVTPDGPRRGSGVCVRHGGDILTSDKLVRGASAVTITTSDGEVRNAEVRGHDPTTDLALLHVDNGVRAAPISDGAVRAGDTVLVVGAPSATGKPPWIGDGIVASVDGLVAQLDGVAMDGLIATSASPGKTGLGGALLDRRGFVAGIVLAPVDGDATTYVVPIGAAAKVADELNERGAAEHGWLGAQGRDSNAGPTVTALTANGPAARAGIQEGDVLLAIAGREVMSMGEVIATVRWHDPRAIVSVKVRRGGELRKFDVTVGATPAESVLAGA